MSDHEEHECTDPFAHDVCDTSFWRPIQDEVVEGFDSLLRFWASAHVVSVRRAE